MDSLIVKERLPYSVESSKRKSDPFCKVRSLEGKSFVVGSGIYRTIFGSEIFQMCDISALFESFGNILVYRFNQPGTGIHDDRTLCMRNTHIPIGMEGILPIFDGGVSRSDIQTIREFQKWSQTYTGPTIQASCIINGCFSEVLTKPHDLFLLILVLSQKFSFDHG